TLGKFAGSEALERKYQTSKEYLEKSRPGAPLKRTINQAFAGAITLEQLRSNLFQSGIGVVYRENTAGRLYGVTFIDHNTGVVLNGSRLGKEYSANAIVDRLENPRQYEHLFNDPQPQGSAQFATQQQPLPSQEGQQADDHSTTSEFIGSSLGLFDTPITPQGDDHEEDEFRRRMQRQKKKGRRM
ncbi:MAG: hypothetical protein RR063_07055, partial [Anaerovoracaceae bacterium]